MTDSLFTLAPSAPDRLALARKRLAKAQERRVIFTALEAHACCVCQHWRKRDDRGECIHPNHDGQQTGGRTITGMYFSCPKWELAAAELEEMARR